MLLACVAMCALACIHGIAPEALDGLGPVRDWLALLGTAPAMAMACAPGEGLAGALANASRGVEPDPGGREWVLAQQLNATDLALGNQVYVKLGQVPNRDSINRHAHVRGIMFSAKAALIVAGATNAQVSAYTIRGLYDSLHMEDVTGWNYFDAIDGRVLVDDAFFRHWGDQQWPYLRAGANGGPLQPDQTADFGLVANAGAATYTVEASLYIPLVSNADGASPLEGLIPLTALQAVGNNALRFKVPSAAGIPGAPAGVTFGGFMNPDPAIQTTLGMEVWLDIVYLDHVVADAPWNVNSYVIAEQNGNLAYPERITDYAAIRYLNTDQPAGAATAGQRAVESLGNFTFTAAGLSRLSGMTLDQMVRRQTYFARTIPDSALSEDNAARDLPMITRNIGLNTYQVFALLMFAQRQRSTAVAGRVSYKIATDPNGFIRFLHRTTAGNTQDRIERIVATTKCSPCAYMAPNSKAPSNGFEPVIAVDPENK